MTKEIIYFEVSGNMFNSDSYILSYIVPGYPLLSGTITTRNPELTKTYLIQQTIREMLINLYNSRKSILDHTYTTEAHLTSIDRLRSALKTLNNIRDLKAFFSYCLDPVVSELENLAPPSGSRFYNFSIQLQTIKSYCQNMYKSTDINSTKLQTVK